MAIDGPMRTAAVWLAALALFMTAPAARAKKPVKKPPEAEVQPEQDASQQAFQDGVKHFLDKDYEKALEAFQKAFALNGHWAVRFNIANCHLELGQYADAMDQLWGFLEEGGDQIDQARRDEAMKLIEDAMKQVAKVRIKVDLAGSGLFIDGEPEDWPEGDQPLYVNPGVHDIEVRHENEEAWKSTVELKPGEVYYVEVSLKGKGKAGGKGSGKKSKAAGKGKYEFYGFSLEGPRGLRSGGKDKVAAELLEEKTLPKAWFWASTAALGATAVLAAIMTVMTDVTQRKLDDLYDEIDRRRAEGTYTAEYYDRAVKERQDLLDEGDAYSQAQAVLWIGAGFFAATTLTLAIFTFKGRGEKKKAGVGLVGPGRGPGLSLTVTF
jgi:tetratricopeptide (TPR) repeat protein